MIDTNIAIGLRDGEPRVLAGMASLTGSVFMSIVTRVELEGGVGKMPAISARRRARLNELLTTIPCLAFGDDDASFYGRIVSENGYSRRKVLDRMIAAQVLLHRATLITMNAADFADIHGLQLLSW